MQHEHAEQPGGYLRRRRRRKWLAPISLNMTPMIDVVFLLLVYFMLVAQFGPGGAVLGMEVRQAGAGERDPFALPGRLIRVSIESASDNARDYKVSCEARELRGFGDIDLLVDAMRTGAIFHSDQAISIEPRDDALWEHALDAHETVRRAGFANTHLAVGGS